MTEPQIKQPHHNNDAKGAATPKLSPFAQLTKSRKRMESMQTSLRSIAAEKKRVQAAEAAETVKKIGTGANDNDNKSKRTNGGKHTLTSDSAKDNTFDDGKQPQNKQRKADIAKVSFANDSDLE